MHSLSEAVCLPCISHPLFYREQNFSLTSLYKRDSFQYYPFRITYKVSSVVKESFNELYFHVLGHRYNQVDIRIGDKKIKCPHKSKEGNLQTYAFSKGTPFSKDHPLSYTIEMNYDDAAGLAAGRKQQFLFYPHNISVSYATENNIQIKLIFPSSLYDNCIVKQFSEIRLRKYGDGFRKENSEICKSQIDKRRKNVIVYWELKNIDNSTESLYVIEFEPHDY